MELLVAIGVVAVVAIIAILSSRSRPPVVIVDPDEPDEAPIILHGLTVTQEQRYHQWDWEHGVIPELTERGPVMSQGFPMTFTVEALERTLRVVSVQFTAHRIKPNQGLMWSSDSGTSEWLSDKAIRTNDVRFVAGGCRYTGDAAIFTYRVLAYVTLSDGSTKVLSQDFFLVPASYFPR